MPRITQLKVTKKDKHLSVSVVQPGSGFDTPGEAVSAVPMSVSTVSREHFVSASQFAKEAGITPQAVRKMISERRLKAFKIGQQHVINKEDLLRYLRER